MLKARIKNKRIEAGCDEVGRGCLCGPVVAAAVILPANFKHEYLRDSKKLSEKRRLELNSLIQEKAISWAICAVEATEIDQINILNASFLAMTRAVENLKTTPEYLLIDGNRFRTTLNIPYECIIKGDAKNGSIAAASILAKTYRDNLMTELHESFPQYGWAQNVGYPTQTHRIAIKKYGATIHHRKSFKLLPDQLSFDL